MNIAEKLTTIAENEQKVYDAGKAKRDYEWWDYYQTHLWMDVQKDYLSRTGDRTGYGYAFAGAWDDEIYNPIREINATTASYDMFALSAITDTKVAISIAHPTNSVNKNNTFRNAQWLKTIRLFKINELQDMSTQFINCGKLENLTIEGTIATKFNAQWCPLTKTSILSVRDALSDTTTGLTCTFKATAVSAAFTDDEWNALTATKPNWTFTTV